MRKMEEKEFNQMLTDDFFEFTGISVNNFVIKDKVIDVLKIEDCEFVNIEIIDCSIHTLKIKNSCFKDCHFVNLTMPKEDAQFNIRKSSFTECFTKNFHINSFRKNRK